jgi:hypothetical protein
MHSGSALALVTTVASTTLIKIAFAAARMSSMLRPGARRSCAARQETRNGEKK